MQIPILSGFTLSPDDEFEVVSFAGMPMPLQQLLGSYNPHKWIEVMSVNPVHRHPNGNPLQIFLYNEWYVIKATLKKKRRTKKKKKKKKKPKKKTK